MKDCPDCTGRGYAVFHCDGVGHSPVELQAVASCDCLVGRDIAFPAGCGGDFAACIAFVLDLEQSDEYAQRCAQELSEYGGPVL